MAKIARNTPDREQFIIDILVESIERERDAADHTKESPEARQYFDGRADAYEHVLRMLTGKDLDAYHSSKNVEPPEPIA